MATETNCNAYVTLGITDGAFSYLTHEKHDVVQCATSASLQYIQVWIDVLLVNSIDTSPSTASLDLKRTSKSRVAPNSSVHEIRKFLGGK